MGFNFMHLLQVLININSYTLKVKMTIQKIKHI